MMAALHYIVFSFLFLLSRFFFRFFSDFTFFAFFFFSGFLFFPA